MARCFLGFELSESTRAALRAQIVPLHAHLRDELGWPVRLVPPDNWHATLLFFSELSAQERAVVWAAVEQSAAAGAWATLDFAWRGLALWPSPRRPGPLCLEAEPCAAAARWPLTARLDDPPFSRGETQHLRRYVPHITLMRFRRGGAARLPGPRSWDAVQLDLPELSLAALRFDRVSFFLSTVSPERPIYPRERTLALNAAAEGKFVSA